MSTKKMRIFSILGLAGCIGIIGIYIFLKENVNISPNNLENPPIQSQKNGEFNPSIYPTIESYLETIQVPGIDMQENFVCKYTKDGREEMLFMGRENYQKINSQRDYLNFVIEKIHDCSTQKTIYSYDSGEESIRFLEESEKSPELKFYEYLNSDTGKQAFHQEFQSLWEKSKKSDFEYKKLIFMLEYMGDSTKKTQICAQKPQFCEKKNTLHISGKIIDSKGNALSGAIVQVLGEENTKTLSRENGSYELKIKSHNLSVIRLSVFGQNASDGFATIYSYSDAETQNYVQDFTVNIPEKIVEIPKSEFKNGSYTLSSSSTQYILPNSFVDENGKNSKYEKIIAYIYEFDRSSTIPNYLYGIDQFTVDGDYYGNTFRTFGMPYILLFDEHMNPLFIKKENPIQAHSSIKTTKDENGNELIDSTALSNLIDISNEEGRLDSSITKKYNVYLPPKWNLIANRGIWMETPIFHLDSNLGFDFEYYNYY